MYVPKPFRQLVPALLAVVPATAAVGKLIPRYGGWSILIALAGYAILQELLSTALGNFDFWLRRKSRDRVWLWTHEGKEWLRTPEGQAWAASNGYRDCGRGAISWNVYQALRAQEKGEPVMAEVPKRVVCGDHGQSRVAFLCQHLLNGSGLGFCVPAESDPEDGEPEDDDLEAWCNACDMALEAEGWEWNDVSEAQLGLKAICSGCFELSRARNQASTRG